MKQRIIATLLALALLVGMSAVFAEDIDLAKVNEFLNTSAKLGEGSKANQVSIIPVNHIDGPKNEDLFYAFVPFKYVARNYIKYQVSFIACTCRSADVNVWSTAYVELSLPSSGKIQDAQIRFLSFDKDSTGKYLAGFWGDSNPGPGKQTYEMFKEQFIPYFIDKTYSDIKSLYTIDDIKLADYQKGEGREGLTLDTWTGATVSANNILRMLQALYNYHASDPFFANDPEAQEMKTILEGKMQALSKEEKTEKKEVVNAESKELPQPIDTTKTYKPSKDSDEVPCAPGAFGPTCSSINASNLKEYLGRSDVFYIDLRDHGDYMKKHIRNFEVIPFFGLIFNAKAHTDATLPQLYGGTPEEPVPVYKESDEILEALFPKNKTIFLMCQSGGRVGMLMNILKARGWDMSKIYNVGGMAQYSGAEYKDIVTDTPELLMETKYSTESLTRLLPAN